MNSAMPPNIEIHLGNVGSCRSSLFKWFIGENKSAKYCKKIADKNPNTQFAGIDLNELSVDAQNWQQVPADFLTGLQKFEDGSVSKISSDLALGYYMSNKDLPEDFVAKFLPTAHQPVEPGLGISRLVSLYLRPKDYPKLLKYTQEVLDLCYEKLLPHCDLVIRADYNGKQSLMDAAKKSKFNPDDIDISRLAKSNGQYSPWVEYQLNKFFLWRPQVFELKFKKPAN